MGGQIDNRLLTGVGTVQEHVILLHPEADGDSMAVICSAC